MGSVNHLNIRGLMIAAIGLIFSVCRIGLLRVNFSSECNRALLAMCTFRVAYNLMICQVSSRSEGIQGSQGCCKYAKCSVAAGIDAKMA